MTEGLKQGSTSRVILAHPGTQYAPRLAEQLFRLGLLDLFFTGFAVPLGTPLLTGALRFLPKSLQRRISNRSVHRLPASSIRLMPHLEWTAIRELQSGGDPQCVLANRNRRFQERIPERALRRAGAVVGFDTSSWILASRTKALSKPFFLDQSICHPIAKERTLQAVQRQFPDWNEASERRDADVLRHEQMEYDLATCIVAASTYTRSTLIEHGVPPDRIVVNPYGVDLSGFAPKDTPSRQNRPFRYVFVGLVGARKGVPLLLRAWKALQPTDAELWLVGPVTPAVRALIPSLPGLVVMGKRPHEELPRILRECDVLAFPSYSEGFGLVLLEALAAGLPIITTEATAGPDLIEHAREGFLIPSGNVEALIAAMRHFQDQPESLEVMSAAARRCAEQYSWDAYGERWGKLLAPALS